MPAITYTNTLVATLGGQPQVVTFTLDLLLRRGIAIGEVIVLHPRATGRRLQNALAHLNAEFVGDRYSIDGRTIACHFQPKVLELDHTPLDDITDNTTGKGTRDTIYSLFDDLKQQPRHIHLSVTGGRRLMSLLAISAAQLKFGAFDHIWHIYTPQDIQDQVNEGQQMHVLPDAGVNLIEVPFFPIADYVPILAQPSASAQVAQQMGKAQMDAQERVRCESVVKKATRRQLDVLRCLAEGLSTREIADKLCISNKTVYSHKDDLMELCAAAWEIPEHNPPDAHFLFRHFSRYFDTDIER